MFLALAIGAVIFIFGPTQFLTNVYLQSLGEYTTSFFEMATMTSETAPAVLAPIATTIWFTLIGGSGIYFELTGVVDLAKSLENFSFDVATLAVAQALPSGAWMAAAVL